jgi:hypothetical protein
VPILFPTEPLTPSQRRWNANVALLLAFAGIGLGAWEAKACAAETFGYVATYAYVGAPALATGLSMVGALLLIYWRPRWVGAGLISAGVLSCAVFYAGMAVLSKADRVAWHHEPPLVSFGPDVKASAVVYFRHGVTVAQIEDFNSSVLQSPAKPRHTGRDYPVFVRSYLRLLPSQANGYDAISLTFSDNARSDEVNAYLALINADPRVGNVFLNTSPSSIHNVSERP